MSAAETLRMAAVSPLWVVCTAGWGVASTALLTWSAIRGRTWTER
jgi:hypothetical protein